MLFFVWFPSISKFNVRRQVKEDPAEFYATTGSHNEWDVDRMQEGNVATSAAEACETQKTWVVVKHRDMFHQGFIKVPGLYFQDIPVGNPDGNVHWYQIVFPSCVPKFAVFGEVPDGGTLEFRILVTQPRLLRTSSA